MKRKILLLAAIAVVAGVFLLQEEKPSNTPQKIECRTDLECTTKVTDCTCGGPIYSCVSKDYPALECNNASFTCPKKQNPVPDSCGCENNVCTARSCAGLCAEWKQEGYARVLENVERLKAASCCSGAEECTDLCAGGPGFTEADLDCMGASSPQDYVRQRCKGYISNGSIAAVTLPLTQKKEAAFFSVSCFYAGERVLNGYAFQQGNEFCDLDSSGMGFLFSPIEADQALGYYLFSTRNISEKKDERQYELIVDLNSFLANRTDCNITAYPPVNRTSVTAIPGGFGVSVIEYLPSKRQAVYEQASVYKNGRTERSVSIISAC